MIYLTRNIQQEFQESILQLNKFDTKVIVRCPGSLSQLKCCIAREGSVGECETDNAVQLTCATAIAAPKRSTEVIYRAAVSGRRTRRTLLKGRRNRSQT